MYTYIQTGVGISEGNRISMFISHTNEICFRFAVEKHCKLKKAFFMWSQVYLNIILLMSNYNNDYET